jgi:hypothetical protein
MWLPHTGVLRIIAVCNYHTLVFWELQPYVITTHWCSENYSRMWLPHTGVLRIIFSLILYWCGAFWYNMIKYSKTSTHRFSGGWKTIRTGKRLKIINKNNLMIIITSCWENLSLTFVLCKLYSSIQSTIFQGLEHVHDHCHLCCAHKRKILLSSAVNASQQSSAQLQVCHLLLLLLLLPPPHFQTPEAT